jgi:hypothetical protein
MRSSKNSHLIAVQGGQYRWRAKGNDGCIMVSIWPTNNLGPFISGRFGYHDTYVDNSDGSSSSLGNQIIVTSRLVRRIIEHAITAHEYDPNGKGKQLDLGALEHVIKWDDAVRASNPSPEPSAVAPGSSAARSTPGVGGGSLHGR